MNKPKYVKVKDVKYEINTDFRVAIRVEEILRDKTIGNYERFLAVVYTLFGEAGLKSPDADILFQKRIRICEYG